MIKTWQPKPSSRRQRARRCALSSSDGKSSRLGRAFDRTADDLAAFNDSTADVRQFKDQVKTFNKTLTSLNAIYGNMLSAMNPHRV